MKASTFSILLLVLGTLSTGCQTSRPATNRRLIEHQALIDFSDLVPTSQIPEVSVSCAIPHNWQALRLRKAPLYTHQQWKSPSGTTGVGVAKVRLPIPLSERAVLWLAKREYTRKANDGREIAQWTDEVGRHWFEAENDKFHIRGYCLVRGFTAWLVYFGHKTGTTPNGPELAAGARSAETFIPILGAVDETKTPASMVGETGAREE